MFQEGDAEITSFWRGTLELPIRRTDGGARADPSTLDVLDCGCHIAQGRLARRWIGRTERCA